MCGYSIQPQNSFDKTKSKHDYNGDEGSTKNVLQRFDITDNKNK